jgi:hypothetical protein
VKVYSLILMESVRFFTFFLLSYYISAKAV